ncbi:MAG: hypothetical protein IJP44_14960, partial [Bacteroidales bacterium]|nr:hypothetical protein [Bacteroidales bacterium]
MTRKIRILILLCCLVPWMRAAADPIITAAGSGSICPGDVVVVPVTVSNCNGVAAISLALNFDATKVSYQGYQNLDATVSSMLVNQANGTVFFSWAGMTAVDLGNATLLELRFTGLEGSTGLNWNTSLCEYSDATGSVVQSNYSNGSVTVYTVPNITSHPSDRWMTEGENTTFDVGASGTGISYQWQVKPQSSPEWENLTNGGHYSNVNGWRLYVNNVELEMEGHQYRCVVSGTCPSPVASEAATLHVEVFIPTIVTSTGGASSCPDMAFSIPVNVTNCNNVGSISLVLNYNSDLVTYIGYESANAALSNGVMRVNGLGGRVYFTWASSNQSLNLGDDSLISFVFRSASGNSSLTWDVSHCEYSTLSGTPLPMVFAGSNLTIYYPPTITSQPSNQTVTEGYNTNFSINASGQGLSYYWQMSQDEGISWENLTNGGHYGNVTSRVLNLYNVEMAMDGLRYRCVVNGTCEPSVTSNYATLHVESFVPTIVTTVGSLNTCSQTEFGIPISVTNCNNVGAISLAFTYNTNVLTYAGYTGVNPALGGGQLQVNAVNGMVFITWASIAGADLGNGNLITINFTALSGVSPMNWNTSYCEYANPQGVVLSASYNNGTVSVGDLSFTITSQPSNQTVVMEESTTFSIATTGPTSGFQWQVSQDGGASWSNVAAGEHYANPNTNTLSVNNVTIGMNGYRYRCVVSGSCGVQYSSVAIMTVQLPVNYYEVAAWGEPAEGGTVTGYGAYPSGETCTLIATPATGYDFVNWTEDGTVVSEEANYTFVVEDDVELVAHFTLQEISIAVVIDPEESGSVNGAGTYLYGDNILLTAIPATGFVFDNWTEDGAVISTNQSISFMAQTDRNLVANFSVRQLSIVAVAEPVGNGSVEGAGTYPYGSSVVLTANPLEGFQFDNWTENDTVVSFESSYAFTAYDDRNLVAHFSIMEIDIIVTVEPAQGGTVMGTGTFNYGDPVILTATPTAFYEFLNWTEDGVEVSTEATFSFTVQESRNLVAHFFRTVNIAALVYPEGSGTVNGTGAYDYGNMVELTATPADGYAFVNWTDNDTVVSTEATLSFMAEDDRTLVANFEVIMYHVSVEANIDAAGTVMGGGDYQQGAQVTVSAIPNLGFDFVRWTENGASVSTNANYTFNVWAPRNLVAEFDMEFTDTTAYACESFTWHGHTYYSSNYYFDTLTSSVGLDSIVALHLIIYPSFHIEVSETTCESYFWEGELYTESGDYILEYQTVHGCDSILTLHLNILPDGPLNDFTYMSPANNYIDRYTDMDFYWDAIPNATRYDFYFWQGNVGRPNTPVAADLTNHTYYVNNLVHGTTYHWCVVAKNDCQESESEIRTFTCELTPSMTVVPRGLFDFGEVEVGQTNTKTIAVSGTALSENISYAFLEGPWGQDAEFFQITPNNWNYTSGGLLHVTFVPVPTQLYYNAALRIASGTFADTVYFTGAMANRYIFTTEVEGEVYSANDVITINGHVEDVLGNPVPNMNVNVYLMVMGTRFNMPAVSDDNGNYSVTYEPRYSESGYYQVGSCASNEYSSATHDAFDIPGMSRVSSDFVIWEPYQNESLSGSIEIRNRSRIPISNIGVNTVSLPNGCTVSFSGVTYLGPLETGTLNYVVTGTQVSTGSNYEEANFVISADNGISMNLTCYYYCRQTRGALDVYPPSIATSMKRYGQKMLTFQLSNRGNGETGPITIGLPNVEWMSVMGGNVMESLPVGDSCAFTIQLAPDENVSLVQYTGSIAVNCANGNGISIPYVIEATSDSTGMLVVDVTDDYTYNTNDGNGPHLAGADVYLKGYYSLETIAQGVTDENGKFIVENVPEGYYYLTIHATQHKGYEAGIIYIEGGKTNHQNIYLQYQAISYSWVVVPTEVVDEYEFELVADIKTNVPVPVVVIEAPSRMDSIAYGDTLHYSITITNHGLVDALDVQLTMPVGIYEYDFYSLFDHIDTLHAKTSVVIPCLLTRTRRERGLISDFFDEHCTGEYTEHHYWMCNSERKWDEYVRYVRIPTTLECNFFGPVSSDNGGGVNVNALGGFPAWFINNPFSGQGNLPMPTWITNVNNTVVGIINTIDPPVEISPDDCEPCWKTIPSAIGHLGDIVGLGTLVDDVLYAGENIETVSEFGQTYASNPNSLLTTNKDKTARYGRLLGGHASAFAGPVGMVAGIALGAMDFVDHLEACITYTNPYRDTPLLGMAMEQMVYFANYYQSLSNEMTNLFQEVEWLEEPNVEDFLDQFITLVDTVNYMVPNQAIQQIVESCGLTAVNDSIVQRFTDRWNRSIQYWNANIFTMADLPEGYDDNFIQLDEAIVQPMLEAMEVAESYGFNHVGEMFGYAYDVLQDALTEHTNDVCAKISVSFKQTMTMTREAFEGTLKIFNGHSTDPMQDINVNIVIKDSDGVDRTDLFQINVNSLSDITGVDGTGVLEAQTEGVAQFMMIPTIEAAPDTTKIYSFGGSFSFLDPFSGVEMTYDLFPVQLKVNPGPNLHVDYFISRHIISDDPLTDTVEATEPAELAMMISNVGAGNANNVYLESSQPQIVDNQNGLLIQFELVGAAMNGVQRPLGLTDIPFGTIESHSAGIAEWYFTSTLMARVIHSTPRVIHNNSYGNPNLSLVTELNSHDLIRAITAYGSLNDGINDFLVNDTPDFDHRPDKVYFSHGGTAEVKRAVSATTQGELSSSNCNVLLTLNPNGTGWNYACLDDPGQGRYELITCTREDGQEIPLSNVWLTYVTMFDDDAPVYENKLHIVDTLSVSQATTYTLVYANELYGNIMVAVNPLNSGTITGAGIYEVGEEATLEATPNIGYTFLNWTEADTVYSVESGISFIVESDRQFTANFEPISYEIVVLSDPGEGGTVSGYGGYNHGATCTLTASANEGYHFVNWTKDGIEVGNDTVYEFVVTEDAEFVAHFSEESSIFTVTALALPTAGGLVTGGGTFVMGATCSLSVVPNEGFTFMNWTKDGEIVSTDLAFSFEVTEDAIYVANLRQDVVSYAIVVTANPEVGGTVMGAGTYDEGTLVTLRAIPNAGYSFVNWTVGNEVISNSPTYKFMVTEVVNYVANFELNSYEITATANPESGGTVTGAGTYDHFSTCTLTATANTSYHFVNWTKDGEIVTTDPTYSFEVSGSADYVANFELNSYDVTAAANPEAGGTVTGAGTYDHFSTCTLAATANT